LPRSAATDDPFQEANELLAGKIQHVPFIATGTPWD